MQVAIITGGEKQYNVVLVFGFIVLMLGIVLGNSHKDDSQVGTV
jgi:hypothetical protein